jgi:hypothetical protein
MQEVAVEGTDRVHVEHIYPQTPAGPEMTEPRAGDRPAQEPDTARQARQHVHQERGLATKERDGYADSDILMTKELLARDGWDTLAIDERQRGAEQLGIRDLELSVRGEACRGR